MPRERREKQVVPSKGKQPLWKSAGQLIATRTHHREFSIVRSQIRTSPFLSPVGVQRADPERHCPGGAGLVLASLLPFLSASSVPGTARCSGCLHWQTMFWGALSALGPASFLDENRAPRALQSSAPDTTAACSPRKGTEGHWLWLSI